MKRIFLGGTCNGSQWREWLKPKLTIDFFDPVVSDWNAEAQEREIRERETCDFCLYVLTPKMIGFFGAVEATLDSVLRPEKVIFCVLDEDDGCRWNEHDQKSLEKMKALLGKQGVRICRDLDEIASVAR